MKLAATLPWISHTAAQTTFPNRPVRIIVPFPPGGGIDIMIRAVAAELAGKWSQPIVVENKAGAGSLIGAEVVALAMADGHTLLATVNQTVTSNRYLYRSLPYDPDRSFAPIIEMVESDQLVLANAQLPANDLKELVALVRREPGKYAYGSFGSGTQPHLLFSLLGKRESLDLTHVPYKGIAPLLTAVAGAEVNLTTASASIASSLMKAGKIKALAVAGKTRTTIFPAVRTAAEQGFDYLSASIWFGLFAPAATASAIIERINGDIRALLRDPGFAGPNIDARGLRTVANSPAEFKAAIQEEVLALREMVQAADVKPE